MNNENPEFNSLPPLGGQTRQEPFPNDTAAMLMNMLAKMDTKFDQQTVKSDQQATESKQQTNELAAKFDQQATALQNLRADIENWKFSTLSPETTFPPTKHVTFATIVTIIPATTTNTHETNNENPITTTTTTTNENNENETTTTIINENDITTTVTITTEKDNENNTTSESNTTTTGNENGSTTPTATITVSVKATMWTPETIVPAKSTTTPVWEEHPSTKNSSRREEYSTADPRLPYILHVVYGNSKTYFRTLNHPKSKGEPPPYSLATGGA